MWPNYSWLLLLLLTGAMLGASAQNTMPPGVETGGDCSTCHSTDHPGLDDLIPTRKCVRARSREKLDEADAAAPDVVLMDQLSDIYVPVVFPHGLHAQMGGMGDGCGTCHHHGESGKIVACRTCHNGGTSTENLSQPGLKGAYHRQCLGCHREWSHDTACVFCHAKRSAGAAMAQYKDPTDITGRLHPNVSVPEKKVYPTPELDAGLMVTFYHKDHIELFNRKCVDCHKKENCGRCHDITQQQPHVRQDPHEDCAQCHDTSDDCARCHMDHEMPPFDHGKRTPFMLKAFHRDVACRKCHVEDTFAMERKKCDDCHSPGWFPTGFDHAETGLALNEAHRDTDCTGCHPNGLGTAPDCSVCHEDKRFPQDSPGTPTVIQE